ncbi:MAG TPA: 5-dehydro-4-deoxyglucarate dehydratase [Candidatus Limnocylindrales bacterium]|nr:5-dehydro-4-deoxyglucarate dehydratase [Candidatus Limnocylindrales bacterium]
MRLHGLLSFPLTPFTGGQIGDDKVDLSAFADHVERQISWEPSAIFVACGTGEFTALSTEEFRQVVATASEVAAGRLPVVAGCGGGPQIAREFARIAAESGADGLLLLPPYLVSSTPAGLLRHIAYVADATGLPLVVYQRANAVLDTETAVALLDLPTVMGIKDGRGDVDAMLRLVTAVRTSGHPRASEFGFLNGLPTAELSAQAYRAIGVDSYSSAVLCFAPDIATAFHRAVVSGDSQVTQRLLKEFYLPFAALRDKVPGYAVSLVKAGASLGPVRPPLVDPSPEHVAELRRIIERGKAAL